MAELINRQAAIDALGERPPHWTGGDYELGCRNQYDADRLALELVPSAQPEQKNEELLPDGTLHLFTDVDLSKVGRVLVSQNGTHYGALYYADREPKQGGSEFISWLLDEIWDEELWELNYRAFPELLCRRLMRLGYLKEEGGKYVRFDKQASGD